jgi:hypothetical protein
MPLAIQPDPLHTPLLMIFTPFDIVLQPRTPDESLHLSILLVEVVKTGTLERSAREGCIRDPNVIARSIGPPSGRRDLRWGVAEV